MAVEQILRVVFLDVERPSPVSRELIILNLLYFCSSHMFIQFIQSSIYHVS